jgi:hypothetical protein
VFSDDVKRISFKEIKGNKYLYLFVKKMILNPKSIYEYLYKFNGERMKQTMLQINKPRLTGLRPYGKLRKKKNLISWQLT